MISETLLERCFRNPKIKFLYIYRVFSEVLIIGLKNAMNLKDYLVRAVLPQLDREGRSKLCEGVNCSCEVCESVKDTTKF